MIGREELSELQAECVSANTYDPELLAAWLIQQDLDPHAVVVIAVGHAQTVLASFDLDSDPEVTLAATWGAGFELGVRVGQRREEEE